MECRLKVEKPGAIEYTLTITMKAEEWEKLREQLEKSTITSSYPAWQLKDQITDLLGQARKVYWPHPNTIMDDKS